jgi:hypothetical protein
MPTPQCDIPLVTTSVACAIGPSVNTFEGIHENFPSKPNFCKFVRISSNKIHLKNEYLPHLNLQIYSNFQQQNPPQNEYLPHLSFASCKINSIKSDLSRAFQQHQQHPQIPIQFSVLILFFFH